MVMVLTTALFLDMAAGEKRSALRASSRLVCTGAACIGGHQMPRSAEEGNNATASLRSQRLCPPPYTL